MNDWLYFVVVVTARLLLLHFRGSTGRRRRRAARLAVLPVVVELVALAEGAAAVGAEEVPHAAVVLPAHVALEVPLLEEAVAAHRAHVRPLLQVVHAVVPQLGLGEEALRARNKRGSTYSAQNRRRHGARSLHGRPGHAQLGLRLMHPLPRQHRVNMV